MLLEAKTTPLKRIIIVLPYLSIIEQTASIYRSIFESHFGRHYILEHHSLADIGLEKTKSDSEGQSGELETAERLRRLLAENWDAPIIVTTSVQMLESLFSNRPSACRKLHRLTRSVILFDEVQTLPANLAVPTLAALSHLAYGYGSSVVFPRLRNRLLSICMKLSDHILQPDGSRIKLFLSLNPFSII